MFVRTKRLTLRPGWPEDARALHAAIAHREVVTMLAEVPWPCRLGHVEAWLAGPEYPGSARMLVTRAIGSGGHEVIGAVTLQRGAGSHRLGYWITPAAWGLGYATEACAALIEAARAGLGVGAIVAGHFADNPGSGRVLDKLGFRRTGVSRRASAARSGLSDHVDLVLDVAEARPLAA